MYVYKYVCMYVSIFVCVFVCIARYLSNLKSLRIVIENCHEIVDRKEKISDTNLKSLFATLSYLRKIDLTGFHFCEGTYVCIVYKYVRMYVFI